MRHGFAAYLILVVALFIAISVGAHQQDRTACARSKAVAANQRLVLRTLIEDRLNGLHYHNQQRRLASRAELKAALARTPAFSCDSWVPFGL